jgi:hypothetical protein
MLERRQNPIGRAATSGIPRITLGGLRLAVLDIEETANFMIEMAVPHRRLGRPLYLTSANGEVLARCSTEPMTERLFRAADLINADGQPLVRVSRFKSKTPLPERVATTDLFDVVARKAAAAGLTFYMFGADEAENGAAVAKVRARHPTLKVIGHCHGYLRGEALRKKIDEINTLAPDYQWRSASPMSRPLSTSSRHISPMSASSRLRADCSISSREAAPARRNGCSMWASNGPGASGSSRAACSGAISPTIRARSICCSIGAGRPTSTERIVR